MCQPTRNGAKMPVARAASAARPFGITDVLLSVLFGVPVYLERAEGVHTRVMSTFHGMIAVNLRILSSLLEGAHLRICGMSIFVSVKPEWTEDLKQKAYGQEC